MHELNRLTLDQIENSLTKAARVTADRPGLSADSSFQPAAVLIPFLRRQDEWHLLFIRRASHEADYHSGQVAFAGGKQEPDDDDLKITALREAQEEIGLMPQDVRVLGQLNYHHSISQYRIMPIVGYMPWPYRLMLDSQEVARAFTIPLNWLANPDNHEVRQHRVINDEKIPVVYFDDYDGEQLWGATARMTLSLISLLAGPTVAVSPFKQTSA